MTVSTVDAFISEQIESKLQPPLQRHSTRFLTKSLDPPAFAGRPHRLTQRDLGPRYPSRLGTRHIGDKILIPAGRNLNNTISPAREFATAGDSCPIARYLAATAAKDDEIAAQIADTFYAVLTATTGDTVSEVSHAAQALHHAIRATPSLPHPPFGLPTSTQARDSTSPKRFR